MRAIIKDDIILKVTQKDGIDLGPKPKGIGLEALRYNGNRIVNLNKLNEIWVEQINGKFVLHCKKYRNSQLVQMRYKDRHHLINDNGTIRLRTNEEIQIEKVKVKENSKKASKRTALRKHIGNRFDREENLEKLVHILMKALIDNDSDAKKFLSQYLSKTQNLIKKQECFSKLLDIADKKNQIHSEDI